MRIARRRELDQIGQRGVDARLVRGVRRVSARLVIEPRAHERAMEPPAHRQHVFDALKQGHGQEADGGDADRIHGEPFPLGMRQIVRPARAGVNRQSQPRGTPGDDVLAAREVEQRRVVRKRDAVDGRHLVVRDGRLRGLQRPGRMVNRSR